MLSSFETRLKLDFAGATPALQREHRNFHAKSNYLI
jgi:hypothetical protein